MAIHAERSRDSERFEVREILGAGGMGVVYRAIDRRLGRVVALKALRQASGRDLYRFKREFRSLADIVHPNLVALHELHTAGDEWFFTMDLVEGVTFIDWVRPARPRPTTLLEGDEVEARVAPRTRHDILAAPVDMARLTAALPQLCDGVLALHVSGKLHRDLKPSNVMVRPDGRVVLLDFGLVSDLEDSHAERTHEQAAVGTPAHMSPEQAADQTLTEASDWYSVGVMLYEALTGRRPFEGTPHEVMRRKQTELPQPPSELVPSTPAALDALCMRLLARTPRGRPGGRAILTALGKTPSQATLDLERTMTAAPFVGRAEELEILRTAFGDVRDHGVAVFVRGDSGMGKSQLVHHFLDQVDDHTLVLEGRCYERESVPFKSLDAVIDVLTGVLMRLPEAHLDAVIPRDVAALVRLFPVLRRVPAVASRALGTPFPPDPQELRRRAFAALRFLLRKLAALQPLILVIDDLQWGDADSAVFLSELIHHPEPLPLLLVLVHRLDDDAGIVAKVRAPAAGMAGGDVRTIDLGPLPDADARRMVTALGGPGDDTAEEVVREAGGHPLFLVELARSAERPNEAPATLDELIARRVAALPVDAASLLRAVAVAGRPMPAAQLVQAAGLDGLGSEMVRLRAERLVRVRRVGADDVDVIEPYHDRVRAAVVSAMPAAAQQRVHAALAEIFKAADSAGDLEALVEHSLGAGRGVEAAGHAVRAARAAEEVLAFHRAADLYRLALEYGQHDVATRRDLLVRCGTALAQAGQLDDAELAFADAEVGASDDDVLEMRRLRLEQILRRGKLAEGLALSTQVLAGVGVTMPEGRAAALRSALFDRARLRLRGLGFKPRREAEIPAPLLRRADVLFSTSSTLGFVDPILGTALQFKFLRVALEAGDPYRIGLALSQELGYLGAGGIGNRGRIEKVAGQLRALLAGMPASYLTGRALAAEGLAAFLCGRWQEARGALESGSRLMRDHGSSGRFELDVAEMFHLSTLFYLGETKELVRLVPLLLREAVERGDVYAQHGLRGWRSNQAWLVMGKPADARAHAMSVSAAETAPEDFHLHHYYELLAHAQIDLYLGDAEGAWQRIDRATPMMLGSYLTRLQTVRVESMFLRARAALGWAESAPARRKVLLADARGLVAQLHSENVPWAVAFAEHLAAIIAVMDGQRDDALTRLQRAQAAYGGCDMRLHAQVVQIRRGQLEGGDLGASLVASARETMQAQAVADPDGMARMLCGADAPRG